MVDFRASHMVSHFECLGKARLKSAPVVAFRELFHPILQEQK